MKILVLHLSDIHFSEEKMSIFEKIGRMRGVVQSLSSEHPGLTKYFILVTGDIADKGHKNQYDIAYNFFSSLKNQLCAINPINEITYIMAPGNHDCDLNKTGNSRDSIINKLLINESYVEEREINELIKVQNDYFDFLYEMTSMEFIHDINKLCWKITVPLDKYKICFYCLNTSYMSREHEKQGEIIFPINFLTPPGEYDLVCTLFHHPYNWFKYSNKRIFKNRIENFSDVI